MDAKEDAHQQRQAIIKRLGMTPAEQERFSRALDRIETAVLEGNTLAVEQERRALFRDLRMERAVRDDDE